MQRFTISVTATSVVLLIASVVAHRGTNLEQTSSDYGSKNTLVPYDSPGAIPPPQTTTTVPSGPEVPTVTMTASMLGDLNNGRAFAKVEASLQTTGYAPALPVHPDQLSDIISTSLVLELSLSSSPMSPVLTPNLTSLLLAMAAPPSSERDSLLFSPTSTDFMADSSSISPTAIDVFTTSSISGGGYDISTDAPTTTDSLTSSPSFTSTTTDCVENSASANGIKYTCTDTMGGSSGSDDITTSSTMAANESVITFTTTTTVTSNVVSTINSPFLNTTSNTQLSALLTSVFGVPGDPVTTISLLSPTWSTSTAMPLSPKQPFSSPLTVLTYTTATQLSITTPSFSTEQMTSTTTQSQPSAPASTQRYRGFNIINQKPSDPSQFKTKADWQNAFSHIHGLMPDANAVRMYSTTDGNTKHLVNALPAAKSENFGVLVGIWSGGDAHTDRFAAEKVALDEALTQFGCDNIIAVSVGNEDMYNSHRSYGPQQPLKDITLLVNQAQEIMTVLDSHNCSDVKVTHTDTFGEWLQTNFSEPLIRQLDFLTVNIFPFWEGQPIEVAGAVFWQHVNETKHMAATYGKDIWIGETGWPTRGDPVANASASPDNMLTYWNQVGCDLMTNMTAFWYVEWDAHAIPSFGLMDINGQSLIGDITCP